MITVSKPSDCENCLCRVCARSCHNDSVNSQISINDMDCAPCYYCNIGREVPEIDTECEQYLPDEDC